MITLAHILCVRWGLLDYFRPNEAAALNVSHAVEEMCHSKSCYFCNLTKNNV